MGIMDRLKRMIFSGAKDTAVGATLYGTPGDNGLLISEGERLAVQHRAEVLVREFNGSLHAANRSRNRELKADALSLAREVLSDLKVLVRKYPFLRLENLHAAESELTRIETTLGAAVPRESTRTLEEPHDDQAEVSRDDADIETGLFFCATLELRTPLRVLVRHGELFTDRVKAPPRIEKEPWEGRWIPKARAFGEPGRVVEETPSGEQASVLGPVFAEDYVLFLIAVRRVVEAHLPAEHRITQLREMLALCEWQKYVSVHGGVEEIVQFFFPRNIAPMPTLSAATLVELSGLGLDTPSRIAAASDTVLLGVKGIGPAKLKAIRAHCADMAKPLDVDRVENVCR